MENKLDNPVDLDTLCTGNCRIIHLVETAICKTCGWFDEPAPDGDPYNDAKNVFDNER